MLEEPHLGAEVPGVVAVAVIPSCGCAGVSGRPEVDLEFLLEAALQEPLEELAGPHGEILPENALDLPPALGYGPLREVHFSHGVYPPFVVGCPREHTPFVFQGRRNLHND
jgi:hypothetical protein